MSTLRSSLEGLLAGITAPVGAGSALQEDFNLAAARENRVIVLVALLVIAIILGILLEAIVAALVLIGTVVISFFGSFFFMEIQGSAGVDASLPTFAFIFLVALGVDYTIFLMSRVREEARTYGTREGVLRALSATGPLITSAGLILAGTFSVLTTLPVTFALNMASWSLSASCSTRSSCARSWCPRRSSCSATACDGPRPPAEAATRSASTSRPTTPRSPRSSPDHRRVSVGGP